MDHQKIKAEEIVDRYVTGKLPATEAEAFENHFFDCDQCFAEVQLAEKAVRGIRDAAARGTLLRDKTRPQPVRDWLERWRAIFSPTRTIVFAALVLALIYPVYHGMQLQDEIAALQRPQVNAQTYALQSTRQRGEGETVAEKIILTHPEDSFLLTFTLLEKNVVAPQYRAEILDRREKALWREENLKARGEYDVFSIACRGAFFQEGLYTLKVYEIDPANQRIAAEFLFPFAIVIQKTGENVRP